MESSPARLASARANSCNRQAKSSNSSRDIAARSVRSISFRSGANRGGTQGVESCSRQSASPQLGAQMAAPPASQHRCNGPGGVNGYLLRAFSFRRVESYGANDYLALYRTDDGFGCADDLFCCYV